MNNGIYQKMKIAIPKLSSTYNFIYHNNVPRLTFVYKAGTIDLILFEQLGFILNQHHWDFYNV